MLQQKPPCTILPPPETEDDTGNLSLWELLEKSRREIQISDTYKDVILLLGNTGKVLILLLFPECSNHNLGTLHMYTCMVKSMYCIH